MFEQAFDAARADALARYPEESCGIVVDGAYIALPNLAADPTEDFRIDAQSYIMNGTLQAVIHSHPHEVIRFRSCPSPSDMQSQQSIAVPFGIIDTDGKIANVPYFFGAFKIEEDLIGKEFLFGVDDCYSIIRKYYWQKHKLLLKDKPRAWEWWKTEQDLYVEGFEAAGFYQIDKKELRDGDGMLMKVKSTKFNHAGIYLDSKEDGHGLVLHHLPHRLSRREAAGPWINKADLFLRHKDVT